SSHLPDRCGVTADVTVIHVMDVHGLPPVPDPYGPAHLSGAAGRGELLARREESRGRAGEKGVFELPRLADRYFRQGPDERVDGRTTNASGLDGDEDIALPPGENVEISIGVNGAGAAADVLELPTDLHSGQE